MRYLVAGHGTFGRLAVSRLKDSLPDARIIVIERNMDLESTEQGAGFTLIKSDAVSYLCNPDHVKPTDWIVPMVPFHLAASVILGTTRGIRHCALPPGITSLIPNPFMVDPSTICCSRADFLCPDDCPEGDVCTVTGETRVPLWEQLEHLDIADMKVLVLRSRQILPGVGGYPFSDLREMSRRIQAGSYILATSCKCHAVLTGVQRFTTVATQS